MAAVSTVALGAQAGEETTVLGAGKTVERQLQGGQGHLYSLTLAAGEYAGVTVEQRGIDVVVDAGSADGKVIAEFDSESRKQGREQVGLVADSPVTYYLRIKAKYPKDPPAGYEVRVTDVRPATELDRLAVNGGLASGGSSCGQAICRGAERFDRPASP